MFVLKFAKMYDNTIFTQYGLCPVAEDYFKTENLTFCVADGVTRDDIYGNVVGYPQTKEEALDWLSRYPNPSGAYESARIVCESFVEDIVKYSDSEISEAYMMNAIKKANGELQRINNNRKIDYLKEDYYCCEAVGGRIINNILYCFSIGDCHITVLDHNLDVVFTTINNHKQFEDYLNNVYCNQHHFDWSTPEARVMVRRDYRNNPTRKYQGKDVSFGALSGQKEAEYYIDTYKVDLSNAKYICAYSDGCEPFFETKEKIVNLLGDLDGLKYEGKERTLIVYEKIGRCKK